VFLELERWNGATEVQAGVQPRGRKVGEGPRRFGAQAARDLDVHENVLLKWIRELSADPQHAFPGHGQLKPEQLEIDRLRKEVVKLKAERDIPQKKAAAHFARDSI